MGNTTTDFIFCPFCGGVKWITDKSGTASGHPSYQLESHKCAACKKFIYINAWDKGISEVGLQYIKKRRYQIEAIINPYKIKVFYMDPKTIFINNNTDKIVLSIEQAVTFNWYKNEELIEKIKKYFVFS
jgi:hypothetical protein